MKFIQQHTKTLKKRVHYLTTAVMKSSYIAIFLIGSYVGCGSSMDPLFITYSLGNVQLNNAAVSIPQEVFADSAITCAFNSLSVLQAGEAIKFVIRSDSILKYHTSPTDGAFEIALEKGNVFTEITKRFERLRFLCNGFTIVLEKGTYDISCHGTALAVSAFSGKARIVKDDHEKVLKAGEKFELFENATSIRKLTPQERRLSALVQKVNLADRDALRSGVLESKIVPALVAQEMVVLTPKSLSETLGMAALARKMGPLSVVTTKKGKKIIGHVRARGRVIEISTLEGVVTLPQKEIRTAGPYESMR